mgnify:CR=1 FL=1
MKPLFELPSLFSLSGQPLSLENCDEVGKNDCGSGSGTDNGCGWGADYGNGCSNGSDQGGDGAQLAS